MKKSEMSKQKNLIHYLNKFLLFKKNSTTNKLKNLQKKNNERKMQDMRKKRNIFMRKSEV